MCWFAFSIIQQFFFVLFTQLQFVRGDLKKRKYDKYSDFEEDSWIILAEEVEKKSKNSFQSVLLSDQKVGKNVEALKI